MSDLFRDFLFGFRLLKKHPTVAIVAILAIAVSIGANTIIFSIVNASLLQPMPVGNPGDVVALFETIQVGGEVKERRLTDGNFIDYARESQTLERLVAARSTGLSVTSSEKPLNPLMRRVSAGYFAMFRVEPLLGREFLPEEDQAGGAPVVILSYGFWQDFFGGDPQILERTIELAGIPHEIVGVVPPGFDDPLYSTPPVLWLPLALTPESTHRGQDFQGQTTDIWAFGKIADGKSIHDVRGELERIAEDLRQRFPRANAGRGIAIVPLVDTMVGSYRSKLLILFVAVGLVLLIACSNVANLVLARSVGRRREIALRCALGAGHGQVVRQLVIEGILLGLVGGGVGLVLAKLGLGPILRWIPTTVSTMPRLTQVELDSTVFLFTLVMSMASGVLFGLLPARQLLRTDLESSLSVGAVRGTADREGRRTRSLLVGAEIAISLVLLVGSGLLIQSFLVLQNMPSGIDSDGVLSLRVSARGEGFETAEGWAPFFEQTLENIRAVPGVIEAGGADILPMTMPWRSQILTLPGLPAAEPGSEPAAMVRTVTPEFFASVAMPILRGRDFDRRDTMDSGPVAIINQSLAERYWGDREPLGDEVMLGRLTDGDGIKRRIIAIVGSTRHDVPDPDPKPVLFLPQAQNPMPTLSITVQGRTEDPQTLAEPIQDAVAAVSREAPVYRVKPLVQVMDDLNWQSRFIMRLVGGFAVLALLLVVSGIYAVLSYLVVERTRELGVRMVVGAGRLELLWMLIRGALRLAVFGIAAGLVISLGLARLLENQLFGIQATDPATYAVTVLFLLLIVVLASAIPALRATRIDPVVALRSE